ncbi:MAG: 5-dehydro-4-deoxy-D-glucuronate isomerase [Bacteroidales bacterium]
MAVNYEERFAVHHEDFKSYDTEKIRKHFLIQNLMVPGNLNITYSHYDRYIVAGAVPLGEPIKLVAIDPLKSSYFLERREMGVINVGGDGYIVADGTKYELKHKEALYIGKGTKDVQFGSNSAANPAHYYINSAPAHKEYPINHVTLAKADVAEMGSLETSNERKINKLLVNTVISTCQMQMGLTELKPGSVWNTMPAHTHSRRMEAYFYFNVPENQAVCHYMGQPQETRHIWMQNEQAVLSPPWSLHAAAGTSNYNFIWGMAGENLDYSDMDGIQPNQLR